MIEILDDPSDWIRLLNLVLALSVVVSPLIPGVAQWWKYRAYETRIMLFALWAIIISLSIGSLTSLIRDLPGGPHVLAYTTGLLLAQHGVVTLWIRLRRGRRRGGDGEYNFNEERQDEREEQAR